MVVLQDETIHGLPVKQNRRIESVSKQTGEDSQTPHSRHPPTRTSRSKGKSTRNYQDQACVLPSALSRDILPCVKRRVSFLHQPQRSHCQAFHMLIMGAQNSSTGSLEKIPESYDPSSPADFYGLFIDAGKPSKDEEAKVDLSACSIGT